MGLISNPYADARGGFIQACVAASSATQGAEVEFRPALIRAIRGQDRPELAEKCGLSCFVSIHRMRR
jgi:hypothetical protein